MAEALNDLGAEISRILNSPYSVSLKTLHQLLIQYDAVILRQWTVNCPHQIQRLASEVIEALQSWPYVVDMVQILSKVKSIRDAIFHASPTLLNHFIEKAISSPAGLEKYSKICVTLLSEPLPSTVPLPATAEVLLHQLFEKAVSQATPDSVRAVHLLLGGACAGLPSILSHDSLSNFKNQLTRMMKSAKTYEEQSLNVYCLAILAQLTRAWSMENSKSLVLSISNPTTAEATSVSYFGAKAHQTLHLLLWQVVFACRNDQKSLGDSAILRVQLAREVLAAIDDSVLVDWVQANPHFVRKLHEKLQLTDLPSDLHLEVFAFAIKLSPAASLGHSALDMLQQMLLRLDYHVSTTDVLDEKLTIVVPSLLQNTNGCFWHEFIVKVVDATRATGPLSNTESCLKTFVAVLRKLQHDHKQFRSILLEILRTPTVCESDTSHILGEWVKSRNDLGLAQQDQMPNNASQPDPRRVLGLEFALLLLEIILGSSAHGEKVDHSLSLALLTLVATNQAQWSRSSSRNDTKPLSIVEELCTPEDQGPSHHWRERLAMELGLEAKERQEVVSRLISQICRDFEARCDNVEEPLRREQMKSEKLKEEYNALERHTHNLEQRLLEQQNRINVLNREREVAQDELSSALEDVKTLTDQKEETQDALERVREDAARVLSATRRDFENQKLELRTTLACNVETIDDQEARVRDLRKEIESINVASKKHQAAASSEHAAIENLLREAETRISSLQTENSHKDQELAQLAVRESSLVSDVEKLQQNLADACDQRNQLIREQDDSRIIWEEESRKLQQAFEAQINIHSEQWSREREDLENVVTTREEETAIMRDRSTRELNEKENIIQELQRKVQKFAKQAQQKTAQLEEAQNLKTRLLTAMGVGNSEISAVFTMPLEDERQRLKSTRRRNEKNTVLEVDVFEDSNDDPQLDSSGEASPTPSASSIASNIESSPKRPRPRPRHTSFKIPTMRQVDAMTGPPSVGVRKRQSVVKEPLAETLDTVQNQKPIARRKSGFTRASTVPLTQVGMDQYITEDEPFSTIPEEFGKSRHTSPVKGGSGDPWRGTHSTGADLFKGLDTADFDSTTMELENIE